MYVMGWGICWIFICTIGSLSLSFVLCCTFGTKEGAAASRAAALLLPTDEDDDDAPLEHMLCGQRSGYQTMPANPEIHCVYHATYFWSMGQKYRETRHKTGNMSSHATLRLLLKIGCDPLIGCPLPQSNEANADSSSLF